MIAETVCSAVAAAGLGIAVVAAYRKRYLTATRIAAYALVPLGLVMTGVVEWLADTAFSPTAWAGFGVLGLSWLLFATTRTVERGAAAPVRNARRHGSRPPPPPRRPAPPRPPWDRRPPAGRAPLPGRSRPRRGTTTSATSRPSSRSTAYDRAGPHASQGVPDRAEMITL